ncbi:Histidine kinase [Sulfidibacter corallicola]|uniref:histidine kinase n=1 Tax=Sulfidibacter corallicola TaxID=2818388 RepID=A0A8A4TKX1_SULCO|nr:ATP-binding protein [Sulfidibacter corallicola]QTD49772.1 HAMP domain-containing protein [Sulfidibacter corallicola]
MDRRWLNLLFTFLLLMIAVLFWHLFVYAKTTAAASLIINILKPLNILLFLVLFFVISRNLVKLYLGRKSRTTGFRLRTKLILSILPLTLAPGLIIFFLATRFLDDILVNLVIDTNVGKIINNSEALSREYLAEIQKLHLKHGPKILQLHREGGERDIRTYLDDFSLQGAELYRDGSLESRVFASDFPPDLQIRAEETAGPDRFFDIEHIDAGLDENEQRQEPALYRDGLLITRFRHVEGNRAVHLVYSKQTPFTARFLYIRDSYAFLRHSQKETDEVRGLNNSILLVTTMVVIFLGIWIGMAFSKNFMSAFNVLISAAEKVSSGNLDTQITLQTGDELDNVAGAFNSMTRTLKRNREELQQKTTDLEAINAELHGHIQYSQTILEKSSAGLMSTDEHGKVQTFNPAACDILDVAQLVEGTLLSEVLDDKRHRALLDRWHEHQNKAFATVTAQLEIPDRHHLKHNTVSVTIVALKNEKTRYGSLLVLEDLTQLVNAQKVAAWREVAKRIAHEIKNPLTPIQLSIQRIQRKAEQDKPDLKKAIASAYETIMSETNLLKDLVNEFSTFAKLPSPVKKDTRLEELIRSVCETYDPVYPDLNVVPDLPGDGPVEMRCDAAQIRQVLNNLIQNAAQASREPGDIRVCLRRNGRTVTLSVIDQGVGVPAHDKDKLFIPYFSKSPKGTGLGLAIVKRIVEDHDGSIRIEDNQPRGTRMIIDLPVV